MLTSKASRLFFGFLLLTCIILTSCFSVSAAVTEYYFNPTSGITYDNQYLYGVPERTSRDDFIAGIYNSTGCTVEHSSGKLLKQDEFLYTGAILKKQGELKKDIIIKGDTNGDGKITSTDYLRIKSHFMRTFSLEGMYLLAADTDENGTLNSADYMQIKQYMARKFALYPSDGRPEDPVELSDLLIDGETTTTIALTSDWHVDHTDLAYSEETLRKAAASFYTVAPDLDGFCVIGDIVNGGYTTDLHNFLSPQYSAARKYLKTYINSDTQKILTMGNHEWAYRDGSGNTDDDTKRELFNYFESGLNCVLGNAAGTPDALGIVSDKASRVITTVVNGIVIFGVSSEDSVGGYQEAEAYLRIALPEAAKQYPNMPILILSHAPIQNTVISTRSNQLNPDSGASAALNFNNSHVCADWSSSFLAFLEDYPQLFYVSGHTHDSVREPLAIQQSGFTKVNDGALCFGHSPALLFTYNEEKQVVVIYRMNVREGLFYSAPWVIDLAAGKADFRYTDARITESASPIFPDGADLKITKLTRKTLTVTYNKGMVENKNDDGYVQSYVFRIKDNASGKHLNIASGGEVRSTYYRDYIEYDSLPIYDDCRTTMDGLSLKSGRSYTLEMFAWGPFYAQSETFQLDFTCP